MAYDKVVDSSALNTNLTSVANTIRTKGGTTGKLVFPDGFNNAINSIATQKPEQEKTVPITENGDVEILPDVGKVLSKVLAQVNVKGSGDEITFTPATTGRIDFTIDFSRNTCTVLLIRCKSMYDDPDVNQNVLSVAQIYQESNGKAKQYHMSAYDTNGNRYFDVDEGFSTFHNLTQSSESYYGAPIFCDTTEDNLSVYVASDGKRGLRVGETYKLYYFNNEVT